jgi:hypothetical protein
MRVTPVRAAILALALLAVGWLLLSLRALDSQADAEAIVERGNDRPLTPAEVRRGRDLLERARRLRADKGPVLTEVQLLLRARRRAEAAAVAREATDAEPESFEAWLLALSAAPDRPSWLRARRQVLRLNPWAGVLLR